MKKNLSAYQHFLMSLSILLLSSVSVAKTIQLHEQPKADSKVVGTVDSSVGVTTIFTPKDHAWTKVADPRDGKVGWVQTKELGDMGVTFNVITSGDGVHGYRFYEYGGTQTYSPQQVEKQIKEMQLRQRRMQINMQQMMQDMFMPFYYPNPVFVPVILVPKSAVQPGAKTKTKAAPSVNARKIEATQPATSSTPNPTTKPVKPATVKQ